MNPHAENPIAIVSGTAQGLGRAIAQDLVSQGCAVYGLDILPQDPLSVSGSFYPVACDVTDEDQVKRLASEIENAAGVPRILVVNAGRYPNRPLELWNLAEFEGLWRLNVGGAFNLMRHVGQVLRKSTWSRVVVISSNAALMAVPGFVPYSATKAALLGMMRSMAAEMAADSMTVNAIAPGLTRTESALSSEVAPFFDAVRQDQMVDRWLEPTDLLSTVRYLCDPASSMITGQTLVVDGGVVTR